VATIPRFEERTMSGNTTLACGEEHPTTTSVACEEEFHEAALVDNPFGSF
jgi:hypothetical protein